jgi:hypothetical protein
VFRVRRNRSARFDSRVCKDQRYSRSVRTWIETKSETELVAAISALTAEESIRRILTAVNQRIEAERQKMSLPREGSLADSPNAVDNEEQALRSLPWRYAKAEEIALSKLEAIFRKRDTPGEV